MKGIALMIVSVMTLLIGSLAWSRSFPSACPTDRALASELLELEVAGLRVYGRKDECVQASRFPHVLVETPEIAEAGQVPKAKFVDEAKPFEIKSLTKDAQGRLHVRFVYRVREKRGLASVEDEMIVRRHSAANRKYFGCATTVLRPSLLVIRRSCQAP